MEHIYTMQVKFSKLLIIIIKLLFQNHCIATSEKLRL
jgi:hypothetical protein